MLDDCWLKAAWGFVETHLPSPPARVLEVGCGSLGGFVPALHGQGYDAVGVDPRAPESPGYHRVEFESFEVTRPVDALVASTSLHHVVDLDVVLDQIVSSLRSAGQLVVIEWAWERFDEASAEWCFARLDPASSEAERGWLHHHRDRWNESGQPWDAYIAGWAEGERLHRGDEILRALDVRFDRTTVTEGPYFFCDLAETTEGDEQAAIDSGEIRATGVRYTGTRRPTRLAS